MRSVRTTFQLLEEVADSQPIGLSELARKSQVPKSTVQRCLNTLADLGWIRPDGNEPTRWLLGDRVSLLNERLDDFGHLREIALPHLEHLNASTLETVHLAVLDRLTARLIERFDSKHALRLVHPIGARTPLHASSIGKGILSRFSEAELDAYLEHGLVSVTEHTITDPLTLRAEVAIIRKRGYAIANQEVFDEVLSVSAPIVDEEDAPIAGISISGPVSRMKPRFVGDFGKQVHAAATAISAELRRAVDGHS